MNNSLKKWVEKPRSPDADLIWHNYGKFLDSQPDFTLDPVHLSVLAPSRNCLIAQITSNKSKPKKERKFEAEKLHIEGNEPMEEGSHMAASSLVKLNYWSRSD
ncbi:hypothetical protein SUGI_0195460 [Cryptomeria japonica]|nr:hypothetical protein SUGI_0195460 [Cryptomeria japonica]